VAEALLIEERTGFALATVMARKGVTDDEIGLLLEMTLASGPRCSQAENLALIGTGPGTWLAHCPAPPSDWLPALQARIGAYAALVDQSGSYVIFRLSGPTARTLLQRGASIDFDPSVFGPGSVAVTVIAHIGAVIWQSDDRPSFEVAIFRSFASSFRHWLDVTIAAL